MKKIIFTAAAASLLITQTGCLGGFNLSKNILEFNRGVSENRIVNNLVFYALLIIPVYEVSMFLDIVLFNLIEFWSGDNPISMEEGEYQEQLITLKGKTYKVVATKNKMSFVEIKDGEELDLGTMEFSSDDLTWNYVKDGQSRTVATFDSETYAATIFTNDGARVVDAQTIDILAKNKLNECETLAFASK